MDDATPVRCDEHAECRELYELDDFDECLYSGYEIVVKPRPTPIIGLMDLVKISEALSAPRFPLG